MGLFSFSGAPDINRGVEEYRMAPDGVLLDVRERDEYAQGRIPGSRNLPLSELERRWEELDRGGTVFVYCLSGGRSRQAAAFLEKKGFRVKNIGGISAWKGAVEK
jgi:rhodanese-related sulfurtransferase